MIACIRRAFSDITEWMKDWVSCKNRQWLVSCASNPEKEGKDTPDEKSTWRCEGRSYRERQLERWGKQWSECMILVPTSPYSSNAAWVLDLTRGLDDPRAYWYWKSKYSISNATRLLFSDHSELLIAAPQFSFSSYFSCSPRRTVSWVGWRVPRVRIPYCSLPCEWAVALPHTLPWDRQNQRQLRGMMLFSEVVSKEGVLLAIIILCLYPEWLRVLERKKKFSRIQRFLLLLGIPGSITGVYFSLSSLSLFSVLYVVSSFIN